MVYIIIMIKGDVYFMVYQTKSMPNNYTLLISGVGGSTINHY